MQGAVSLATPSALCCTADANASAAALPARTRPVLCAGAFDPNAGNGRGTATYNLKIHSGEGTTTETLLHKIGLFSLGFFCPGSS